MVFNAKGTDRERERERQRERQREREKTETGREWERVGIETDNKAGRE